MNIMVKVLLFILNISSTFCPDLDDQFEMEPVNQQVMHGQEVTLRCKAPAGIPRPMVSICMFMFRFIYVSMSACLFVYFTLLHYLSICIHKQAFLEQ